MLFNSINFLIFFPIVVLVYFAVPEKLKKIWLLLASYFFYMCWNAKYVVLILFCTMTTYLSGIILEKIRLSGRKDIWQHLSKLTVAISIILNLVVLFYFKYINFALSILQRAFLLIHIDVAVPKYDILLPVGISFYTFQALSYTMDVYRGEVYAERNFLQYALFVSFFPQLVAGPIERSKNLLKQLSIPLKANFELMRDGMLLMIWGFFLKIVIADRIAVFVNTVYGDVVNYTGWYLIVATILFAFQIYCDFMGYSVIAMGAAEILGIHLSENFAAPYLADSIAEFWRRWHITLTTWFKDYLYIPLGGNRKGKWRKYLNKIIVFCASGLWHGASLSFVVWGGINGLYQVIGEAVLPYRDKAVSVLHLNRKTLGHKLFHVMGTFLLVDFSWIFFRAESLSHAFMIIRSMVGVKNPWILFDGSLYNSGLDSKNFGLMIICLIVLLFADFCKQRGIKIRKIIVEQDYWFRWLFFVFAISFILLFGKWGPSFEQSNFIYFQF